MPKLFDNLNNNYFRTNKEKGTDTEPRHSFIEKV